MLKPSYDLIPFIICIVYTGGQQLVIEPDKEVVTKSVGENLYAECKGTGPNPPTSLTWLSNNGMPIRPIDQSDDGRIYVEEHFSDNRIDLYIRPVELNDNSHEYKCEGLNAGVPVRKSFRLVIIQQVQFVNFQAVQSLKLGEAGLIRCKVTGQPPPDVDWRINGRPIDLTSGDISQTGEGLAIRLVRESHEGVYTCRAKVKETATLEERNITVGVHIPPSWLEQPQDVMEVSQKLRLDIRCRGEGKPQPNYVWYRGSFNDFQGVDLIDTAGRFIVKGDTLTITEVRIEDEGKYTCEAKNTVGEIRTEFFLDVKVPPMMNQANNVTVKTQQEAQLKCVASGDPLPSIRWRRNDYIQYPGQPPQQLHQLVWFTEDAPLPDHRYHVSSQHIQEKMIESTFKITLTEPEDAGKYLCEATNVAGIGIQEPMLIVEFAPNFAHNTMNFEYSWLISGPHPQPNSNRRNLTCLANGMPYPSIKWEIEARGFRNQFVPINELNPTFVRTRQFDQVIRTDRKVESILQVQPMGQGAFTNYRCVANNPEGEAVHVIQLRQATIPGPPLDVTIPHVLTTTVTFSIRIAVIIDGLQVTGVRIRYRRQDINAGWDTRDFNIQTDGRYFLSELEPKASYEATVFLINPVGEGGASLPMQFTTQSHAVPSDITTTSKYMASDTTKYTLTWFVREPGGYQVTSCRVDYQKVYRTNNHTQVYDGIGKVHTRICTKAGFSRLYLVALEPNQEYHYKLRVSNMIGSSSPVEGFFKTMDGPVEEVIDNRPRLERTSLGTGAIVGIVIAAFIAIIIIIDVACFLTNECGILMCLCVNVCGRRPSDKSKDMDMVEQGADRRAQENPVSVEQQSSERDHDDDVSEKGKGKRDYVDTASSSSESCLDEKKREMMETET